MNQQEFDDKIRASLEAVEVPYEPESWAALERQLDMSMDQSVTGFDTAVRNALDKVAVPFDAELWNVMSLQLDRSAAIRKTRILKLAEAAVILLLAFQTAPSPTTGSIHQLPSDQLPPASVPVISPMASNLLPVSGVIRRSRESNSVIFHNHETTEIETPTPSIPLPDAVESVNKGLYAPDLLSTLKPPLLSIHTASPDFFKLPGDNPVKKSPANWFIAAFSEASASIGRNSGSASFSGLAPGFGIAIGKDSGKWGFETGFQVNRNSYIPDSKTTVYAGNPQSGFLATYNTGADATTVAVPFRVSRKIAGKAGFEMRALAGIAAELVAEKNYSRRTVYLPPAGQSSGGSNLPAGTIPDKVQNGILEGGSISNNLSANAQFGLRVKAKIGSRYSIFVEPVASLNLAGAWGPEKEKVDRYSVRAGVYARL